MISRPPHFTRRVLLAACAALAIGYLLCFLRTSPAQSATNSNLWDWPVEKVGVARGYEAPASEFGPGHRGIDLKATTGDRVLAIRDGIVDFVGQVALTPTVSLVHEGGWRSSYQPVVSPLHVGQSVTAGQTIGAVGEPTEHSSCLHLGLKYQGLYLSPLAVLGSIPRAVLLPW